jgi:NADH-quinone oxidoreductase subunit A
MDPDNNAWSLLFYFVAVLIVAAGMIGLPYVLGERHWQRSARRGQRGTNEPYESGIIPTGTARLRLPIQYYFAAMFFVVFDLEAVFIYAWAIAVPETGWLGFGEMALFIAILLVALAYLWRVGALNWSAHYRGAEGPSQESSKEKRDAMVA